MKLVHLKDNNLSLSANVEGKACCSWFTCVQEKFKLIISKNKGSVQKNKLMKSDKKRNKEQRRILVNCESNPT